MIPHGDNYPTQHLAHRGWRILIPYEDKVDVITPTNIFVHRGWRILAPHEDKDVDYDDGDGDDDDDDDDCKCGATSGLGRTCLKPMENCHGFSVFLSNHPLKNNTIQIEGYP